MNQCSLGSFLVVNGCNVIGRGAFNCFILYVEVEADESAMLIRSISRWRLLDFFKLVWETKTVDVKNRLEHEVWSSELAFKQQITLSVLFLLTHDALFGIFNMHVNPNQNLLMHCVCCLIKHAAFGKMIYNP